MYFFKNSPWLFIPKFYIQNMHRFSQFCCIYVGSKSVFRINVYRQLETNSIMAHKQISADVYCIELQFITL